MQVRFQAERQNMGWECVHHIFGCDKQRITASEFAKEVSSRVITPYTHLRTCLQNTYWIPNHIFSIQKYQETNIDSPSLTLNPQTCIYNWFLKININKQKGLIPEFQLSPDTPARMGTHQTGLCFCEGLGNTLPTYAWPFFPMKFDAPILSALPQAGGRAQRQGTVWLTTPNNKSEK